MLKKYDVGIAEKTDNGWRGWFEHHIYGEDAGGGLWFDEDGVLEEYDGVYSLPKDVIKGIEELGFEVDESLMIDEE